MKALRTLLTETLSEQSVIYVARDIERALAFGPNVLERTWSPEEWPKGYYIVTNDTDASQKIGIRMPGRILSIPATSEQKDHLYDTHELLSHPSTITFINKIKDSGKPPRIVVFKNTATIERVCREHSWTLLNPRAAFAKLVEEKMSQVGWLDDLACYLPPHELVTGKDLTWNGTPYIVQFNHGHTGEGTLLITAEKQVRDLHNTFPDRPARRTQYIPGTMFTLNAVVVQGEHRSQSAVVPGSISHQITGLIPFTDLPFATVGNDWGFAERSLSNEQKRKIVLIAKRIGKKLADYGWRGLFGIDVIVSEKTGGVYLIEVNARQPASTTFESALQRIARLEHPTEDTTDADVPTEQPRHSTIFEVHLAALLGIYKECPHDIHAAAITHGAQLVQRITSEIQGVQSTKLMALQQEDWALTIYTNTEINSDLVRVQSLSSFLSQAGALNEDGRKLRNILES